ncbi:hypothetical protein F4808DRAFT_260697 [Astrocystis sublimbata]|nr:hypothetical protein F4808DRAFT_260697 [Astrocystis sublimbata]
MWRHDQCPYDVSETMREGEPRRSPILLSRDTFVLAQLHRLHIIRNLPIPRICFFKPKAHIHHSQPPVIMPDSSKNALLALTGSLTGITTVAFRLRFWTRRQHKLPLLADDWFAVIALVSSLPYPKLLSLCLLTYCDGKLSWIGKAICLLIRRFQVKRSRRQCGWWLCNSSALSPHAQRRPEDIQEYLENL